VNTLYVLEEWRGEQRISPPGIPSPLGDKIHPWGTNLPVVVKFTPRGEVKNGPLAVVRKLLPPHKNAGVNFAV
jgi:hypothetical protein